jgi:hypothetical protein
VSPAPLHYMRITPLDEDGNPFYSVDGNKITFHKAGAYRLGNALGTLEVPAGTQAEHVRFYDEEPDASTAPVARSTTDCTVVAADTRTQVALGDRELPGVFTTHNLGANVEVIVRRTSGPNGSALVDMMINGERDDRRKLLEDEVANLQRRLRDAGRAAHIQANRLQVLAGHIDKSATGWTVDSVRKQLRDLANEVCEVPETHGMHVDTHRDDEPVRRLAHAMTEVANQLDGEQPVISRGTPHATRIARLAVKLRETVNTWTTEAQRRPWAESVSGSAPGAIANRGAVDKLVTTMRTAADGLQGAYRPGRPPYVVAKVIEHLRADADAWAPAAAPESEGEVDLDGLYLASGQAARGPITYPAPTWDSALRESAGPVPSRTPANHSGCEHVLEAHSEDDGCEVDGCPCKATLSGLGDCLPMEAEALQQPREGTPITQRFSEVVAVLEDAAKAMRAVQVRLSPGDQARLGVALARVQKLLGQ